MPSPKTRKKETENDRRVSGGECKRCGFRLLPNGCCGVCFHARRIGLECAEYVSQEPQLEGLVIDE